MIRLLVNVPPHKAGSRIEPGLLDEIFVQRLLDAGQAEEVEADVPTDPAEVVLGEVFELEDQLDAAISRRARVVMLIDGLDEDGRAKVERALETATRMRPELFGQDEMPVFAIVVATEDGFDSVEQLRDRARIGKDLILAIPPEFDLTVHDPVEIVGIQATRIADLEARSRLDAARMAALNAQLDGAEAEVSGLRQDLTAAEAQLAALKSASSEVRTASPPPVDAEVKGKKTPKA